MMNFMIIISVVALIFSVIGLVLSIINSTKLNSTHSVQYMNGDAYSDFQKTLDADDEVFYDKEGNEITDPVEREKIRVKNLGKGFEEAYSQE